MTESPERPLEGRSVLVTRPVERAVALTQGLRDLGAHVEARPTIALEPPADAAPARESVREIAEYDWVLFTSPSGVSFFFDRLHEEYGADSPSLPRMGAIGPATARALQETGHPPQLVATESHAEGFAQAIEGRIGEGDRVLLVRPQVARAVLGHAVREKGAVLDAVPFYRNVPASDVKETARRIVEGRFDVVIFTSPSTLTRLLDSDSGGAFGMCDALERVAIVAIGEVTARALERNALRASVVASQPSDAALIEAVCSLFAESGLC